MSGFSWGEQLTVIYVGDKILVNTVSFGAHRLRSPFHVSKCQRISDRFAEELDAEPPATRASLRAARRAAKQERLPIACIFAAMSHGAYGLLACAASRRRKDTQ